MKESGVISFDTRKNVHTFRRLISTSVESLLKKLSKTWKSLDLQQRKNYRVMLRARAKLKLQNVLSAKITEKLTSLDISKETA